MSSRLLIRKHNDIQEWDKYYDVVIEDTDSDLMIRIKYQTFTKEGPPFRCWVRDVETFNRVQGYIDEEIYWPTFDDYWTIKFENGAEIINLEKNTVIYDMVKKVVVHEAVSNLTQSKAPLSEESEDFMICPPCHRQLPTVGKAVPREFHPNDPLIEHIENDIVSNTEAGIEQYIVEFNQDRIKRKLDNCNIMFKSFDIPWWFNVILYIFHPMSRFFNLYVSMEKTISYNKGQYDAWDRAYSWISLPPYKINTKAPVSAEESED